MRTLKLGLGKGTEGEQGCWMAALSVFNGDKWTDKLECVDPLINALCIEINDSFQKDDEARTKAIMEFGLLDPLGTRGTKKDELRRELHVYNHFIKKIQRYSDVELHPITDLDTWLTVVRGNINRFHLSPEGHLLGGYNRIRIRDSLRFDPTEGSFWTVRNTLKNLGLYEPFVLLRELVDLGPCAPKEGTFTKEQMGKLGCEVLK